MKACRVVIVAVVLLTVWSAPFAGATPSSPAVIMDLRGFAAATAPDGRTWLVWAADDGHDSELLYSRWNGQGWSPRRTVFANPDAWDSDPSLAFSADGTAWLAWTSADRETSAIYVSRWVGYRWSEPGTVPVGDVTEVQEPTLAAAPNGTMWLAWVGFDGTDDEILASHWDGDSWSAPWQVSADDGDAALYDRQPRLAVDGNGQPWLVWTGHQAGVDDEICASRWTGGGWTAEQAISRDDDALDTWPSLALDAQGQPWVAWKGRVTDGEHSHLRILVSHWDASRSSWTAEAVASSPLASAIDEEHPALSLDVKGGLHLVWLATGNGDSALAHTRWEDGRWTEPRLIRAGVTADTGVWLTVHDDVPWLLWLDPSLDAEVPADLAPVEEKAAPLSDWIERQVFPKQILTVDPISNRFLAFGDSITWGQYPTWDPFYPYPSTLQDTLNVRVMPSDVINAGVAGEGTGKGRDRIKDEVSEQRPQYVMIMEGTNNVSHNAPPADVLDDYLIMIDNARRHAGVGHVKVMLATLIPRLDDKNDETAEMNQEAVFPAASIKNVPVCDPWQAFVNYGPYEEIYWDEKHPDQTGLNLLADTFYNCLLTFYSWLDEDSTPPTTWLDPLPDQSECGLVSVSWTGTDNLSWVVDYDVQMKVNDGNWTDWLTRTQETSSTYTSDNYGDVVAFQVRGRDVVGNTSEYSAPEETQIADSVPPYEAHVNPLPPIRLAPFGVSWWGADACADVVAYNVQYRAGTPDWVGWLTNTPSSSGSFSPTTALYGETYYFRVQAKDAAGNWSEWSAAEAHTTLAQFSLRGHIHNGRHQPVVFATVDVAPSPLWLGSQPGGFLVYVVTAGDYDISVSRDDLYGPLPTMFDVTVSGNGGEPEFILPPPDEAVTYGGFEAESLDAWQVGGSTVPTLTNVAHTGEHAVRLGGAGTDSHLSQVISPGLTLSDPTLSFLVRLDAPGSGSVLQTELANSGVLSPPVSHTLLVATDEWVHVWYDLTGLVSEPLTLTFVVSDSPVVVLDEISLGSALKGGYVTYLPLIYRGRWTPCGFCRCLP